MAAETNIGSNGMKLIRSLFTPVEIVDPDDLRRSRLLRTLLLWSIPFTVFVPFAVLVAALREAFGISSTDRLVYASVIFYLLMLCVYALNHRGHVLSASAIFIALTIVVLVGKIKKQWPEGRVTYFSFFRFCWLQP
jgi:hypothetical protein